MKFGNRFKKQQPLIPQDIYVQGSESISTERARGGPSTVGWENQQNEESSPAKKGLHVLKKLNCGAAMNRDRHEENLYPGFTPQHTFRAQPTYVDPSVVQEQSSSSPPPNREPQSRELTPPPTSILKRKSKRQEAPIVRPVLITVNDGDLGGNHSPHQPQPSAEFKSTFLVGPGGTTIDPMKRTVTPEKEERKAKNCVMTPRRLQGSDPFADEDDPSRNCLNRKSPPKEHRANEMEEMEELQRIARRNRWKRGMERSRKDDNTMASASAYGEESTYASSYHTYEDSTDDDSYTEGSEEDTQWTGYTSITGRSRRDHRGQRRSKSLSRRRNESVFDSVAEDLGVVASMLFSDGTSCISGAMDITRETIVSCKQN